MVRSLVIVGSLLLVPLMYAAPLKALIVDGQNRHHDWRASTPVLKTMLEKTNRFSVSVATTPQGKVSKDEWQAFSPAFNTFDVVILNYWGKDWSPPTLTAFQDYVKNGGGVVFVHSAVAGFGRYPAIDEMIGLGWRGGNAAGKCVYFDDAGSMCTHEKGSGGNVGHSHRHPFAVDLRSADHPIINGLPNPWQHKSDELYHRLRGPAKNLSILGSAKSPITKVHEPLFWAIPHGKGRSFVTVLGHDVTAMSSTGFQTTLTRGAEWAATGAVTIPAVANAAVVTTPKPAVIAAAAAKATSATTASPGAPVSRAVIEKHLDPSVKVYGKYAAVKLPITNGPKLWNPTVIEAAPDGTIYVANYTGEIFTLHDTDGDGLEDSTTLFCNVKDDKLRYPTGLAIKNGEVYVATTQEIRIYKDTNGDGVADESRTFFKDFPWTLHYWDWTFALNFGPDGHLYAILCTDYLNGKRAPDPKGLRGSILRIAPDGKSFERHAYGLRFPYGMTFNHLGDLFFSDNKGGGNPTEEFNRVVKGGYYGHNDKKYPDHGPKIDPLVQIKHGYGSGGLCANSPTNDFDGAAGDVFFACWGPDGRWERGSIVRIKLSKQSDGTYKAVEIPVAKSLPKVADLAFGKDGSLYAARFGREGRMHVPYKEAEGDVYRFFHAPWLEPNAKDATTHVKRVTGDVKRGKQLYTELACASCHALDGTTELLGPNLKGIGDMFARSEMMTAIVDPSASLKSGHETTEITKKSGDVLIGRMVSTDEERTTIMLPGNLEVVIPAKDVAKSETLEQSLMPAGLLPKQYGWKKSAGSISLTYGSAAADDLFAFLNVREDPPGQFQGSGAGRKWKNGTLDGEINLARKGKASSPDQLEQDNAGAGDAAVIDGDLNTYWDETDNAKRYVIRIDFDKPTTMNAVSLVGYKHHSYAARNFDVVIDGTIIASANEAQYKNNQLLAGFKKTTGTSLELQIRSSYAGSPAIRELGIYNLKNVKEMKAFSAPAVQTIWSFNHGDPLIKPFFHPVAHPKVGKALTDLRPKDHVWHRGLWYCWKKINGINYWEENGKSQQSQGLTETLSTTVTTHDDHSALIQQILSYHKPNEAEVVSETRKISVSAPNADGDYHMDWDMTFTAQQDATFDVHRGPSWGGYGGMSFRAADDFQQVIYADSEAGLLADPKQVRHGKSANWHSIFRDREGVLDGITMFDHPSNVNHQTPWYVYRGNFRFLNPSPAMHKAIILKKGKSLRLRYRILVHAGKPDPAALNAAFESWTK